MSPKPIGLVRKQRMSRLDLVVPGLFGPFSIEQREASAVTRPALVETLLGRADLTPLPGTGTESVVWRLFGGGEQKGDEDIPVAAISRMLEVDAAADGWWIHADPVFLKPDRDRLLLFDAARLEVELPEAQQLADLFNQHYQDRQWQVQVAAPTRWYLRLPSPPKVVTSPLWEVVGRNIDPFLPEGTEARDWRFVMNEVQMLFHTAPANQLRSARGLPAINGLWFWGGGKRPSGMSADYVQIYSDMPFVRGLAQLSGVSVAPLSAGAGGLFDEPLTGNRMLVYPDLQRAVLDADLATWQAAVTRLDGDWIQPAWRALKTGALSELRIYPCSGSAYRLDRGCRFRFWRRAKSLL